MLTQEEISNAASALKRVRDDFIDERIRLETARHEYESNKHWTDAFVFIGFLVAVLVIGILIGWRIPH